MEDRYIKPNLMLFKSFEESVKGDLLLYSLTHDDEREAESENFINCPRRSFILADPGYGKSRFLKEALSKKKNSGGSGLLMELKNLLPGEIIVDGLTRVAGREGLNTNIENDSNFLVCLDGLDEVKQDDLSLYVEKIKDFVATYDKTIILISCRQLFFKKYADLFSSLSFEFARIFPFTISQVKEYLTGYPLDKRMLDRLINTLKFGGRDLVIQVPRYLELLAKYIVNKRLGDVNSITRCDLFEYFIYGKLSLEDRETKEIIKRVLEKLALIMEMYQTSSITKDELMTFFDDIKSDLKVNAIQKIPLNTFYNRTLLKDNGETIEFDNTEFQEYLAAKEITRLGHFPHTVFDLVVDPNLGTIHPSWFNTLTFLIELQPKILKNVLNYGQGKDPDGLQDEDYHRLITKVNLNLIPTQDKKKIFENVLEYYQKVQHWINFDIAENLSYYYDDSHQQMLKKYVEKMRYSSETQKLVQRGNIALIVGFLLGAKRLSVVDIGYWKEKLIFFAKDKNKIGVLQRHSLFALEKLEDDSIISKVKSVWRSGDELVSQRFLDFCGSVNPNHPLSLKIFIDGTKRKIIQARYGLYEVRERKAISKVIGALTKDDVFLYQFLDQESIFHDRDHLLIDNIKNVLDRRLSQKIEQAILASYKSKYWYEAEKSVFISNLAKLVLEQDNQYLHRLTKQIFSDSDLLKHAPFSFDLLFSILLTENDIKGFIDEASKYEHGKWFACRVMQLIKFSKRTDATILWEEGRGYLAEEYKEVEKLWQKEKSKPAESQTIYQGFLTKLEPKPKTYDPGVFEFYTNNQDQIDRSITQDDKKRLTKLITGSIFEKFDPADQSLTITKREGGSTSYTTHSWISVFGDAIEVAAKLNLDAERYTSKLISYIPFSYHSHLEAIFSLIGTNEIDKNSINRLLKVYKEKKSDLWQHMPSSFIQFVSRYKIAQSEPILKEFIENKELSINDRVSALEARELVCPDCPYLEKVFTENLSANKELAYKSNALLIERYNNKDAINWLFTLLKDNAKTFIEPKGAHSVGDFEDELHHMKLAKPLINLKSEEYINNFLDLLSFSFDLNDQDPQYSAYSNYIWQIVSKFFDGLKELKSYQPIRTLEQFTNKNLSRGGANWFLVTVEDIKRTFLTYLGRPENISDCINTYNSMKVKQYLAITSVQELHQVVKSIIETDLRGWLDGEGRKTFQDDGSFDKDGKPKRRNFETTVQKLILPQLKLSFLQRGIMLKEINIAREPQIQDDSRVDFLISYGFIGHMILEVKLRSNPDLLGKMHLNPSFKKLKLYVNSYDASSGIFLVINDKEDKRPDTWGKHLARIIDCYNKIERIEVVGL
ncbi:MAG: hypothetical protein WC107_05970 [Patescibacteria group bacterium]